MNFNDNDPILIAKAAPIESYWTQKLPSKRIVVDTKGGGGQGLYQSMGKTATKMDEVESPTKSQIDKDLKSFEE